MAKKKHGKKKPAKPLVKEQTTPYGDNRVELPLPIPEYERYEIIEGVRYDLSPAPTVIHQKIAAAAYIMLYETCDMNGTLLFSPIDVYLDEDNQLQPDIVFITHQREHIVTDKRIEGAPDLVLEILSPSTSHNDKIRKKRQYERFGVKEFWIADPFHRTVDQFILMPEGSFILHATYADQGTLHSPIFPCISIDLSRLFPPLPEQPD